MKRDENRETATAYPIVWVEVKEAVLAGYCAYSHDICKLAMANSPDFYGWQIYLVKDTYVSQTECEESTRCLARHCHLNKTEEETLGLLFGSAKLKSRGPGGYLWSDWASWLSELKPVVEDALRGVDVQSGLIIRRA